MIQAKRGIAAAILTGLVLLSTATDVVAWGPKGHRLVALVARELLTADARSEIVVIMGSDDLPTFANYLDVHKDRLDQQIPGSRDWHYDDVPVCGTAPHSEYCPEGKCASTQIPRYRRILSDAHETKARKQFAVYVISHLVGDIHQPLHAADNDDRGGNEVKVKLPSGKNAKLHGAWDTDLVEQLYGGKNERTVAKTLVERFAAKKTDWQKGTVSAWIAESHELAETMTYGKLPGFACGVNNEQTRIQLPQAYGDAATTMIEEQIAKAGYRLAWILNRALGD